MTIYINGVKASKADFELLCERVRRGVEFVREWHITKRNNIAIITV
jgi:hypothetical protein